MLGPTYTIVLLSLVCSFSVVNTLPMGLFVSTHAIGNGNTSYARTVAESLKLICRRFNVTTSPNRIHSLALDHLTDSSGAYLSDAVAFLDPWLRDCFQTVYVGLADNHFASDIYCAALANTTFKNEWVRRSLAAAKRFSDDHPAMKAGSRFQWYLNYEAAGNYFGTGCSHFSPIDHQFPPASLPSGPAPAISAAQFTDAYAAMFSDLTQSLILISNTSVMWSPTFNVPSSELSLVDREWLLGNVTQLFSRLPLLQEIVNQDAIG